MKLSLVPFSGLRVVATAVLSFISCAALIRAADVEAFAPVLIKGHPVHPTRLLAKVRPVAQASAHASVLTAHGMRAIRGFDLLPGFVVLDVDASRPAMAAADAGGAAIDPRQQQLQSRLEALRASGLFDYVEPDYVIVPDAVPADAAFANGTLWGLRNTGQSGGVAGVDIDAVRAWDITKGSTSVIVAVLDSGVRATHVDLAANMWRNPGEIAGNGRDDDGNGYIDDVFGLNAMNGSGDVSDPDGHGTHVAGTIGAAANNGQAHVGVAWNVRIMACKIFADSSDGLVSAAIAAMDYAVAHGAKILNCSWGLPYRSVALEQAIAALADHDVLLVAAAGNDGGNADFSPHFPSSYEYDHVISVAAIDRRGDRASFSNFGLASVDLGAPGVEIYSSVATSNTAYDIYQGTSMAAPHVAGIAALVRARFPGISVDDLRNRLLQTTTPTSSLQLITATGGRVNAYRALTAVGDGQLELSLSPPSGTQLFHGRSVPISVRVSDLAGVTGATVTAIVSSGGTLTFRDNGIAPDVRANDGRYTALFPVPASGYEVTLSVSASAPGKAGAQLVANYSLKTPPLNDNFADRLLLETVADRVTTHNLGATVEPGEGTIAGENGGASLWWTWTAPAATTVTIDTVGSDFDTLLAVYTGSGFGSLAEVASNDDIDGSDQPSRVTFEATAGTTYQIVVDGWEGKTGYITLNLATTIAPENDHFANRTQITGGSWSLGSNTTNSTHEPGDPSPSGAQAGGSVWWTWIAPSSGTATVRVESSVYPFHELAVFTGSELGALTRIPARGIYSQHHPQEAVFRAEAGHRYELLVVAGVPGAEGKFTLQLSLFPGPANDAFADRLSLVGTSTSTTGSNANGTAEPGEPRHTESSLGASAWWTWTAPHDGTAIIEITGSNSYPVVAAYTGPTVVGLVAVPGAQDATLNGSGRGYIFLAAAGTTYQLAVDSHSSGGDFTLSLELVDTPANNAFADRIPIVGTSVAVAGTTVGATRETGESTQHVPAPSGMTVWWSWTAPETGTATCNIDHGQQLAVFTGSSLATLSPVYNSARDAGGVMRVIFHAQAGTTYQFMVDGHWGYADTFTLQLALAPAPANDFFADRMQLQGTLVDVTANNDQATGEPGEIAHGNSGLASASLWWTWTAPRDGTVILSVTSNEIPLVSFGAYTGNSLSTLVRVFNLAQSSNFNQLIFTATGGQAYSIAVDGAYGRGQIGLRLEFIDHPPNDSFANRTAVVGNDVELIGSNRGATAEVGEPMHASRSPRASVWWTWTAPVDGVALADATGSPTPCVLGVYTGGSVTGLVNANFDRTYDRGLGFAAFPVKAGQVFHIALDNPQGVMGEVRFRLSMPTALVNDQYAAALPLEGAFATAESDNFAATIEPGEPVHMGNTSPLAASVWWRWTAPGDGGVTVTTRDSDYHSLFTVYSGPALHQLSVRSGTNLYPFTNSFQAIGGETYWIAVEGTGSARGRIRLGLSWKAAPGNDAFAARRDLSGATATASGSTDGAGSEPAEPGIEGSYTASLWWSWTAPANGTASVTLLNSFSTIVQVYTGDGLGTLIPVTGAEFNPSPQVVFRAEAGTNYHVRVASRSGTAVAFQLQIELHDPPLNDRFENRIQLSGTSAELRGSTRYATREPGEPDHLQSSRVSSVWWSWTAPQSGRLVIQAPDGWSCPVAIYTGSKVAALQHVADSQNAGSLGLNVTAGTAYQIAVSSANLDAFVFPLVLVETPFNDHFADRVAMAGESATARGTTLGATSEAGEPWGSGESPQASVWWTWQAPASGRAYVELADNTTNYNFAVYTGQALNALVRIAGSNDGDYRVAVVFDVSAGTDYHISVDNFGRRNEVIGEFLLRVGLVTPPPNDAFADRLPIPGIGGVVGGTNLGATGEPGEPGWSEFPSVWWSWTAMKDCEVIVSTAGGDFEATLVVYVGDDLPNLVRKAYAETDGQTGEPARTRFSAVAGTTYQFSVAGLQARMGAIQLTVITGHAPVSTVASMAPDTRAGEPLTLVTLIEGTPPYSYQWLFGDVSIPGATAATYAIPSAQRFDAGTYQVIVGNEFGLSSASLTVAINDPPPSGARLNNLSTRALDLAGDKVLIPGFVIEGPGNKRLLIRGVGPTLAEAPYYLPGVLPNPRLLLKRWNGTGYDDVTSNDDWSDNPNAAEIITRSVELHAFPLLNNSGDAVLLVELEPGQYSVVADDPAQQTGIAIVELYDADSAGSASTSRLINISNRGYVGTGDNIMIPGFVVSDEGPKTLLIRVVGPTLGEAPYNVPGVLADPTLTIYRHDFVNNTDDLILTNDDWSTGPGAQRTREVAAQVLAFPLPEGSKDAAFVVTLNPGVYTVHARGKNETEGVALVEVYAVP